ncbi:AsmA family protein [Mitsuokella jalaludinii]|uniref:Uncharacterized protein n=1 Tax=Mitsuokella jalaludinii TaxID=187979 RepID=A0A173Z464_9FIRM|nr:hypothetical protein [Mitsuokella jalaludinii]CUN71084.1 Uncharacterised protein [Mitsuokella jalaludinii]
MSWFHLPSCSEERRAFGKKCLKRLGLALLVVCLLILLALEIISRGAAQIFNYAMANQDMLRGTITVERLISDITGHVYFTGLEWKDREGNPILEIPSGDFRVNVWDVLTRDFKSTTIRELTVNQPSVSVHLSDDMKVDFVRPSPDMDQLKKEPEDWREKVNLATLDARERRAVGQWRREHHQQKVQRDWHNFNAAGKHLKLRLNVHDGGVEVFYRERHYVMSHVQMAVDLDTAKQMSLDMSIGGFGGTMIGDAIALNGTVDFTTDPEPVCNTALVLYQIDPSSLGFGMNIHDKMTLSTYFTGPVSHPIGTGKVEMDELHIPGLDFANVEGKVYYENSLLQFTDVTADVYKGKLTARGDYDLDTRFYNLYGHGEAMQTESALPKSGLHTRVDLDLEIHSEGSAKSTVSSGSFVSGPGRYRLLPFDSLSGKVTDAGGDLHFYDAVINLPGFTVSTDAFHIQHGKLSLNPIKLTDKEGKPLYTFVPDK